MVLGMTIVWSLVRQIRIRLEREPRKVSACMKALGNFWGAALHTFGHSLIVVWSVSRRERRTRTIAGIYLFVGAQRGPILPTALCRRREANDSIVVRYHLGQNIGAQPIHSTAEFVNAATCRAIEFTACSTVGQNLTPRRLHLGKCRLRNAQAVRGMQIVVGWLTVWLLRGR